MTSRNTQLKYLYRYRSHHLRLTVFLITFLLHGCSQFTQLLSNDLQKAQSLLNQQDFYPALDVIDKASPDHPQHQQLVEFRNEVLKGIKTFEKNSLEKTQHQINHDQWQESLETLDLALEKVPASKPLREKRQRVENYIAQKNQALSLSLAQSRATTLSAEISILEDIARYSGDRNTLEARKEAAKTDRELLMQAARQYVDHQQWSQAKSMALKARAINDDQQVQSLILQIEKRLTINNVAQLQEAIELGDLLGAQQLANNLKHRHQDAEVSQLLETLQQKVEIVVLDLTRKGQQAYTNGNVDSAITHWQQAYELQPQNTELKKRLERARAFQQNYRRLKGQ